jgi:ubiquinone/menaquinone biosynthesis C-methylase UbiE
MDIANSYDRWASQYDTDENKTRDLEAIALRSMLGDMEFRHCLELGCGTGKNTGWLIGRSKKITAVDLSTEMLAAARRKIQNPKVKFVQANLLKEWRFIEEPVDLVSFSLVLEHIEHLGEIFGKASAILEPRGHLYLGELHPYKQYSGTKARFDTSEGRQVLTCFNHHISDFIEAAQKSSLQITNLMEFFDDEAKITPRIISLLFKKL